MVLLGYHCIHSVPAVGRYAQLHNVIVRLDSGTKKVEPATICIAAEEFPHAKVLKGVPSDKRFSEIDKHGG